MKPLSSLVALGLLLPGSAPQIEFEVADGTRLEKHFEHTLELDLVQASTRAGDVVTPMPEAFRVELTHTAVRVFQDTYLASADGRPVELHRTLRSLEDRAVGTFDEGVGGPHPFTVAFESELVGEALGWSTTADGPAVHPLDEESVLEPEQLTGLEFDLDALGLLPAEGEFGANGWEVEPAAFAALLGLGGDVLLEPVGSPEDDMDLVFRSLALLPALGDVSGEARVVPSKEHPQRFVIRAVLEARANSWNMLRDWLQDPEDPRFDGIASLELRTKLELGGELEWVPNSSDSTGGRLGRLELEGSVVRSLRLEGERAGVDSSLDLQLEGRGTWSLTSTSVPRTAAPGARVSPSEG